MGLVATHASKWMYGMLSELASEEPDLSVVEKEYVSWYLM